MRDYRLPQPIVLKSGNLNLLEPSGLVQGCNGIAFTGFRSDVKKNGSAPFWDYTQSRVAIPYRHFGRTYRSHLQGSRKPRKCTIMSFSWQACCRDLCLEGTGFELQLRQTLVEVFHLNLPDPYFTKYLKLLSYLMWRYTLAHMTETASINATRNKSHYCEQK